MDMLLKYDWPGNVRELENAVERAVILLAGEYVTEKELPLGITHSYIQDNKELTDGSARKEARSLEEIEKEAILSALEAAGGNKSKAARTLGITRKTVHKKLEKYGAKIS
jgi:two-component system response regulator HydG